MEKREWVPFKALRKQARIKRLISLFCEAGISVTALVMAVVYGVRGDRHNRLFTCLMTGLLLWVPIGAERLFKHRFSFSQHISFILLLLGGALLGSVFYLFYTTSWFDCFMHVLAGYFLMVFLLMPLCRRLTEIEEGDLRDKRSAAACTLVLLLCSLGTACLWELVEFFADMFFGQTSQGAVSEEITQTIAAQGYTGVRANWETLKYVSVMDTDLDMLCHAGGSIVFCLHYLLHALTGKNLGMGSLVRDIRGEEMNRRAAAAA